MRIQIKKLHELATVPTKATDYAGGWDVTCTEIEQKAEDFYVCKLGFAAALPYGYKLTIVPRSSITGTKWIMQNSPGLGDSDYRGEYQMRFRALPESTNATMKTLQYPEFPFKVGDRVGQVYLEEVIPIKWEVVDELPDSHRGEGGFGSTGK
jgi:dUTP pyrophosphatase